MSDILSINTHKPYSEYGQRIAATRISETRVYFEDVDRGVGGIMNIPYDVELDIETVVRLYELNRYEFPIWSDYFSSFSEYEQMVKAVQMEAHKLDVKQPDKCIPLYMCASCEAIYGVKVTECDCTVGKSPDWIEGYAVFPSRGNNLGTSNEK